MNLTKRIHKRVQNTIFDNQNTQFSINGRSWPDISRLQEVHEHTKFMNIIKCN
ncbi:hypothetical protein GCM10010129_83910 [Streptomyces fumigatiscleroticus]|nr:hypothetical protein GCM10010129_83910 [Streptomyces fumigatiscleroticus]